MEDTNLLIFFLGKERLSKTVVYNGCVKQQRLSGLLVGYLFSFLTV